MGGQMPTPNLDHKTTGYGPMVRIIVDRISNEITSLCLTVEDILEMAAVAERHGASIMNVHRAFESLELCRFVDYNRSARTASVRFTPKDITGLTQSRLDLEIKALQRACMMPDRSDWSIISGATYCNAATLPPDMRFHQHMLFYRFLYGPGSSENDAREFKLLMESFKKYFIHLWRDPQFFVEHMNVAKGIIRLCMVGDDEAACDMHARHIEETRDRVLRNIHLRDTEMKRCRPNPPANCDRNRRLTGTTDLD
jgi:hypothetical protein